ncbi:Protein of unknown function [Gryllus bimaculatus]|nr:Protein of unknown function [Gryllus bimaculatus]
MPSKRGRVDSHRGGDRESHGAGTAPPHRECGISGPHERRQLTSEVRSSHPRRRRRANGPTPYPRQKSFRPRTPERNYERAERNFAQPERQLRQTERSYAQPERNFAQTERTYALARGDVTRCPSATTRLDEAVKRDEHGRAHGVHADMRPSPAPPPPQPASSSRRCRGPRTPLPVCGARAGRAGHVAGRDLPKPQVRLRGGRAQLPQYRRGGAKPDGFTRGEYGVGATTTARCARRATRGRQTQPQLNLRSDRQVPCRCKGGSPRPPATPPRVLRPVDLPCSASCCGGVFLSNRRRATTRDLAIGAVQRGGSTEREGGPSGRALNPRDWIASCQLRAPRCIGCDGGPRVAELPPLPSPAAQPRLAAPFPLPAAARCRDDWLHMPPRARPSPLGDRELRPHILLCSE